ncbi:Maf family protein [Parvibium lacunae]|uniref:dTTP/UTP pyrophosphatase n=1 Tax=Parvibium lacunae TaxID=1888893 RepID=A0A368L3Z8_9BURK|nr:Maf family protein [Parvibium lacunae]RCS58316.1 septum formation protein Maf [Parvibium lacunae]
MHTLNPILYLASQSPRRQALLTQLGASPQPLLAAADEDVEALEAPLAGEPAAAYVQRVATLKAAAAAARRQQRHLPAGIILSADTTVSFAGEILGKPADAAAAQTMLARLSGQTHEVLTAVVVENLRGERRLSLSTSQVTLATLSAAEIAAYIATGEPFGKAGSYALQGRAAMFVTHASGSFSGIIGLPLHETATLLAWAGYSLLTVAT